MQPSQLTLIVLVGILFQIDKIYILYSEEFDFEADNIMLHENEVNLILFNHFLKQIMKAGFYYGSSVVNLRIISLTILKEDDEAMFWGWM